MSAGNLFTGLAIAGGFIAFAWIGGGILDRVDDALDENTDGDWPHLPDEARRVKPAGKNQSGGEARSGQRTSFAHTQTRPSSHSGQDTL